DVFLYQATQHVPLIVKGPGIAAARRILRPVGLIDVLPTLLDLLEVRRSADLDLDGESLVPLLRADAVGEAHRIEGTPRGGTAPPDRAFEMESFFPAYSYNWAPSLALASWRWKYIAAPRPELYDLSLDPKETRNLLVHPSEVPLAVVAVAA